jgi:NADPH:quinone reductase-like Zn-dependent oxidoreductase
MLCTVQGADGGIDSVGGETLNQIVQSLKPDGTVLVYGAMSGFTAQVDLISLLFNTITVKVCAGCWHMLRAACTSLQLDCVRVTFLHAHT